ncbi:MAG TPA: cytochrome c [Bryobacteraceae bacterium]|nr:cytochrome c [Bryobacteraceae bacterium]
MTKPLSGGAALLGCSAFLLVSFPIYPHDPITTKLTWTQEISRIVYRRCASCHKPGGTAMSLMTYEEARPWAKAIRDQVTARRMPPWGPVAGIGDFKGDPSLSGPEIDMFVAWVEGGAPEGDPAYLPHRIPDTQPEVVSVPAHSRPVVVSHGLTLKAAATLMAIRPTASQDGASLEAWAELPGGEIQRLIWLKDFHKDCLRTYVLRTPETLPAGASIHTEGTFTFYLR